MAWIRTVEPEAAGDELRAVYDRITGERGKLAAIMQVQSLRPRAITAHLELYQAAMFASGGVSRAERELIAVVVSATNGCRYCVSHHAAALMAYWNDETRVQQASENWRGLDGLPARERSMLDYAEALTRQPATVGLERVVAMRDAGLSDDDVLSVNLVVAYYNFVNRIAEGLGVELDPEEVGGYRY
ncbi:MAG TPA: peroxidase-related enzyme [Longimicrobium sp.]|nr:peroxidase-related enzyme [Longimicrobium sp.]